MDEEKIKSIEEFAKYDFLEKIVREKIDPLTLLRELGCSAKILAFNGHLLKTDSNFFLEGDVLTVGKYFSTYKVTEVLGNDYMVELVDLKSDLVWKEGYLVTFKTEDYGRLTD